MTKKKWNKLAGFIFLGLCAAWICYSYYKSARLIKKYKLTVGQINHISPPGAKNNSRGIKYEYFVHNKKFLGDDGIKACDNYSINDLSQAIVNKKFYVAYDSTDLSSSIIILTEKQAKKFNVSITDTLLHYDSLVNCMEVYGSY